MPRDRLDIPYIAKGGVIPPAPGLTAREREQEIFREHLAGRERAIVVQGLRGVGKTALLHSFRAIAREEGWVATGLHQETLTPETDVVARLRSMSESALRDITLIDPLKAAGKASQMRLSRAKLKAGVGEVEWERVEATREDDPSQQVIDIVKALGESAASYGAHVVLLFDELQALPATGLRALINAINYAQNAELPLAFAATGLPSVLGAANEAVPSALSVLRFPEIDRLDPEATRLAFALPARLRGEEYTEEALDELARLTRGYPFFIQTYGTILWVGAQGSPIDLADVARLRAEAEGMLDREWFAGKLEGLNDAETDFVFALGALGPGSHSIAALSAQLKKSRQRTNANKNALVRAGLIYEMGKHSGRFAFSIPLFGEYLARVRKGAERYEAVEW